MERTPGLLHPGAICISDQTNPSTRKLYDGDIPEPSIELAQAEGGEIVPWFKVDDKFTANQKVTRIPRAKRWSAIGLWTLAGAWSADQLTDGFIPQHQFDEMGASQEDADQLCLAHLWSAVEGGFQFNNWGKYQPSAAEVSDKLERLKVTRSLVGKKGAAARWGTSDSKMANQWQDEMPKASNQTCPSACARCANY